MAYWRFCQTEGDLSSFRTGLQVIRPQRHTTAILLEPAAHDRIISQRHSPACYLCLILFLLYPGSVGFAQHHMGLETTSDDALLQDVTDVAHPKDHPAVIMRIEHTDHGGDHDRFI